VFNAILVVVSHVVDPTYRDDKLALSRLDYAMNMINRMSISHACAQRAYSFLQQLLGYMGESLFSDRNIQTVTVPPFATPLSQQSQAASYPTSTILPEQHSVQNAHHADFFALLDVTQDLAENLGSQLESHEAMGSGMWSWMDDNMTEQMDTITIASNYAGQ
jgi:hypothetical protein